MTNYLVYLRVLTFNGSLGPGYAGQPKLESLPGVSCVPQFVIC